MKLYRIAIVALFGVFASLQTVKAQSVDEKLNKAFQIVTSSTPIDKQTAQGVIDMIAPLHDQLDDASDAQKPNILLSNGGRALCRGWNPRRFLLGV